MDPFPRRDLVQKSTGVRVRETELRTHHRRGLFSGPGCTQGRRACRRSPRVYTDTPAFPPHPTFIRKKGEGAERQESHGTRSQGGFPGVEAEFCLREPDLSCWISRVIRLERLFWEPRCGCPSSVPSSYSHWGLCTCCSTPSSLLSSLPCAISPHVTSVSQPFTVVVPFPVSCLCARPGCSEMTLPPLVIAPLHLDCPGGHRALVAVC